MSKKTNKAAEAAAVRAEEARLKAMPPPTFEDVMTALRNGARLRIGLYRYNETFFLDGDKVRKVIFDETVEETADSSAAELRQNLERHPEDFRRQLSGAKT